MGTPQNYWLDFFFSFKGRITRKQWWLYCFPLLCLGSIVGVILDVVSTTIYRSSDGHGAFAFLLLMSLIFIGWPAWALSVKRWQDRNKSGLWIFINFIPVIGPIWMLVENGFLRGTSGNNKYGPDPLASEILIETNSEPIIPTVGQAASSPTDDYSTSQSRYQTDKVMGSNPPNPQIDDELKAHYGIVFDGANYFFGPFKYTKLEDAINYAKLRMGKKGGEQKKVSDSTWTQETPQIEKKSALQSAFKIIGFIITATVSLFICFLIYVYQHEYVSRKNVKAYVSYTDECGKGYPLWIKVQNNSSRTVNRFQCSINVRIKGRSSIVGSGVYETDIITEPGEEINHCIRLPKIELAKGQYEVKALDYKVEVLEIEFGLSSAMDRFLDELRKF